MNPANINTTNVQQFGFRATFDLENARLILDISNLTIFKTGGASAIIGINFSVIDPSDISLSIIDFPSLDISPADIAANNFTYEVTLSGSPSQYGFYKIKGVLRESDGHDYSVEMPAKEICQPKNISNGIVPGKFEYLADCTIPKISISEITNLTYKSKLPEFSNKTGMLYYPAGTLDPLPFSYTPFSVVGSGRVYTGDYVVRNKTVSTYNLGDNVYVMIAYGSTIKFTVNCMTNICDILCCVEKFQSIVKRDSTSLAGRDAKQRLDSIAFPLTMALTMEKCGKNAGDLIESISQTLQCDCGCGNSTSAEPKAIITSFDPVVLDGQCATSANLVEGIWVIKTKNVSIIPDESNSEAFTIIASETECARNYTVKININILTGDILNEIKDSPEFLNIFNSLVQQSGFDLSGLDGKCIISTSNCDYSLTEDASNAQKLVASIIIDGVSYAAPNGTGIQNALAIKNWLNGLNKGTFDAYYAPITSPATTVITTTSSTHVIGTMTFTLLGNPLVKQFSKNCGSFQEILQAIINYLCDLTDDNIKLSKSYIICYIAGDGLIKQTVLTPSTGDTTNHVSDLMTAFLNAYCTSLSNIKAQIQLNCADIKAVFVDTDPIKITDGVYGSRNGKCGVWSQEELAKSFLDFMTNTNDTTILQLFCALKDRCTIAVCNPVTYVEVELIEPCPGISTISGTFTN